MADAPDADDKPVQALDAGDIALLKSYVRSCGLPLLLPPPLPPPLREADSGRESTSEGVVFAGVGEERRGEGGGSELSKG